MLRVAGVVAPVGLTLNQGAPESVAACTVMTEAPALEVTCTMSAAGGEVPMWDRVDRMGHYPRVAQHSAGGPAARSEPERRDLHHAGRGRRTGRSRPAHLEPGLEHARAELPRDDRRYPGVGQRCGEIGRA